MVVLWYNKKKGQIMALSFLFGSRKPAKKIADIEIDIFKTEVLTFENEVTEFPIQDGSLISDHVVANPFKLRIEGVIPSNKGILPFGGNRRDKVYEELIDLYESRELFDIVTGLDVFENMIFRSLAIDRQLDNAAGLEFSAECQQLLILEEPQNSSLLGLAGLASLSRKAPIAASPAQIAQAVL